MGTSLIVRKQREEHEGGASITVMQLMFLNRTCAAATGLPVMALDLCAGRAQPYSRGWNMAVPEYKRCATFLLGRRETMADENDHPQ